MCQPENSVIEFRCQNCNQKICVPKVHAGKKGKCPKCKNAIVVPKSDTQESPLTLITPDIETALSNGPQQNNTEGGKYRLEQYLGIKKNEEPIPQRKFPWLIDIFLYPFNAAGLTILAIVIISPMLVDIVAVLLGPFGFMVKVAGFVFIKIPVFLYAYWYYCECIRNSAQGQIRAPETVAITPDIGELIARLFKIVFCCALFFLPVYIYFRQTGQQDWIFWSLITYGCFFFPMALLAVVMFDSLSGLNPIVIAGSILSTFFWYCALLLLFSSFGILFTLIIKLVPSLTFIPYIYKAVNMYWIMVCAHLLGRFYWRYSDKLRWEV